VAASSLFDHLEAGYTIDGFLEQFPSVRKEQVETFLEELRQQTERDAQLVSH